MKHKCCPQVVQLRLIVVILVVLGLMLTACSVTVTGPGKPADEEPPAEERPSESQGGIISFNADRNEILPGECVTLQWETEGGYAALLNGQEVDRVGQMEECLGETTPFILELDLGDSMDRRELLVRVGEGEPDFADEPPPPEEEIPEEPGPEPMPGEPHFEVFLHSERPEIAAGECTVLVWEVAGPDEIDVRTFLNGNPVDRFGEREVCPQESAVYLLEAETDDFFDARELVIEVFPGEPEPGAEPPPPEPTPIAPPTAAPQQQAQSVVIDFWVDNNNIKSGDCTTLRWHVEHANAVHLDGAGVVGDDTKKICPTTTSVYVLHVAHDAGATEKKVTVVVAGSPTPTSASPPPGGSSWGILTADLAVTDLYPDNQPMGTLFARITNHGPQSVSGVSVQLNCAVERTKGAGGSKSSFADLSTHTVTLKPGETKAYKTAVSIDTNTYSYKITCTPYVQFKDPNTNDSYTETIPPSP